MLAVNRHQTILRILDEQGSVRTIDLAERLNVTDETVRRDLEKLERENHLQRTHGGAILSGLTVKDRTYEERRVQNREEKRRIAKEAAKLIASGDRVYIDASSTALQLASLIKGFEVSVITHSTLVARELEDSADVELLLAGGAFDRKSYSCVGPAAIATLQRYRIDKAFLSGNGIDPLRGISEINENQANIKETVIPRSGSVIFLADSSKLGAASNFFFAPCDALDVLVTNSEAGHPILDHLVQKGVRIIKAE